MAKHKITFNGDNATGHVRYAGVTFPSGKAVTVEDYDADMLRRLSNNPEFTVTEVAAKAA